jgi:hypothetical protein
MRKRAFYELPKWRQNKLKILKMGWLLIYLRAYCLETKARWWSQLMILFCCRKSTDIFSYIEILDWRFCRDVWPEPLSQIILDGCSKYNYNFPQYNNNNYYFSHLSLTTDLRFLLWPVISLFDILHHRPEINYLVATLCLNPLEKWNTLQDSREDYNYGKWDNNKHWNLCGFFNLRYVYR